MRKITSQLCALIVIMLAAISTSAYAADTKLTVTNAVATSYQSGEGIEKAYDGNTSTIWHSAYSGTSFPVNATFTLSSTSHVDYIKYTPRSSGTNGNFQEVTVYVSSAATTTYSDVTTEVTTVNLQGSSSEAYIYLGKTGVDNVRSVRLCIKSGQGGWASAAEISFYKADNTMQNELANYFDDALCTQLKSTVTSADGIGNETVKTLVSSLLSDADGYKKYRVGEFEPYETLSVLRSRLKISAEYCAYENPTGIYFKPNESIYILAQDIPSSESVSLIIKNWGKASDDEAQSQSSFMLHNGLNVITPTHRGNGYVSYYSNNYATLSNVKLHFINATVTGYFDLDRGDTNADWKKLLSNATSDILDVRTKRLQVAFPLETFKANCPNNGVELAKAYDEIVRREREVMGLLYYNKEPKNRQFFRVVHSGFMFADNIGAAVVKSSVGACISGTPSSLDFWGMAHELGHNNQLTRSFKWSGCGETTNNIYSAWVQYNLGNKNSLRLEDEKSGIDDYAGMRGGRFEAYLEEGVRKGISWQLQDGPDYHGATPTIVNVQNEDYNGNKLSTYSNVETRNYDHFLKCVPLWQLQLYTHLAGRSPNMYGKVMEGMRKLSDNSLSNGRLQVQFMKLVCDSTQMNFLPFFEKAGMLRPINAYIEDYSKGWLKINASMINTLKRHVSSKGYAEITDEVNYITAHNWQTYAERKPLEGSTLGSGCTASGSTVRVDHSVWKNAVAFETYNSEDSLIRITMYGLGSNDSHSFTTVLYPQAEDAAYIMAVGYDGTRIRCYEAVSKTFKPGNKIYRIVSNVRNKPITSVAVTTDINGNYSDDMLNNAATATTTSTLTDVHQLWRFEPVGDGSYYLVNLNTGLSIGGSSNSNAKFMEKTAAGGYTLVNQSDDVWALYNKTNGQYLNNYGGASGTNLGYWSGGTGDNNNLWKLEEVPEIKLSVASSLLTSAYLPFAIRMPEGLTAYTAIEMTVKDGTDVLVLEPLPGGLVPAYTPAVLIGERKTHTIEAVPDDNTAAPSGNLLRGTLLKMTGITAGTVANITNNSTSGQGIYIGTVTTVPANRAYMLASDLPTLTSPGNGLVFSLNTTGIENAVILGNGADNTLYNLQGQRVMRPTKGIYITGSGKKVYIK